MSFYSFVLRKLFQYGDNKRDAGLSTPADIQRYDDIQYGADAKWNMLDVYRPKAANGTLPVTYRYYGDKEHVLGHVFHCNMRSEDAKQCNQEECDFFRKFCDEE